MGYSYSVLSIIYQAKALSRCGSTLARISTRLILDTGRHSNPHCIQQAGLYNLSSISAMRYSSLAAIVLVFGGAIPVSLGAPNLERRATTSSTKTTSSTVKTNSTTKSTSTVKTSSTTKSTSSSTTSPTIDHLTSATSKTTPIVTVYYPPPPPPPPPPPLTTMSITTLDPFPQDGWGQCGGIAWSGPTTCVEGWTCDYVNAYYSQCLPGDITETSSLE